MPSPFLRVSCDLLSYLPGTERETPLQMEIYFINVNFPYKRVRSTLFSELLYLQFLKNYQLKIILMPEAYLGVAYSACLSENNAPILTVKP